MCRGVRDVVMADIRRGDEGRHTKAPITNGMQNHVLFFTRRKVCAKKRTNMTSAAMAPPAMVGLYGQSTYAGGTEESSVDDIVS